MNRSHSDPIETPLPADQPPPVGFTRNLTIIGAIAAGVGLVGFLIGISGPVEPARAAAVKLPHIPTTVRVAPSYSNIEAVANLDWQNEYSSLKQDRPGLFDPVHRTTEMKNAALLDRLRTRAFDGAPPVVPHSIQQQTYANCLVCHAEGMKLGDRIAAKISHPHYANCTQCHVEGEANLPFAERFTAHNRPINEFVGQRRAGAGDRIYPGAPPTIPHSTHMRTDCMSCHGLLARPGLRTTHPWLQNCVQCHASSTEQDWPPGVAQYDLTMSQQPSASTAREVDSSDAHAELQ